MPRWCIWNWESICGVDVDDIFVFEAPKLVRVREARLGLLYLVFVVGIVIYICVGQLMLQNSYLEYKEPIPSVRLTLQQPTLDNCNPNNNNCQDVVPSLNSLSYCCNASCARQSGGACSCPWRPGVTYDCAYFDGLSAGIVTRNQVLISTFVKDYEQSRNTSCGFRGCSKMWASNSMNATVVPGIAQYTVAIDHSVTQPELGFTFLSRDMNGMLAVEGSGPAQQELCKSRSDAMTQPVGGKATDAAPCYIQPDTLTEDNIDILRLETLLKVMGVDLDPTGDVNIAQQYLGMTATIEIKYFNVWENHVGTVPVQYIYRLSPLLTPYKKTEVTWLRYPDLRLKRDVRGILFSVVTTGQLGKFYFQTLLLTITTSLTLITVATVLVKQIALNILKRRKYYRQLIYHTSADFSDVRVLEHMSDQDLHNLLNQRQLPRGGTRENWIMRILEDKDIAAARDMAKVPTE